MEAVGWMWRERERETEGWDQVNEMRYRGEIQRHKIWDELEEKYKDTKSEMRYRGEIQKLDEIESRNTKIRWDREEKYKN